MYLSFQTYQGFIIKNLIDIFAQICKDEICLNFDFTGISCEQITTDSTKLLQCFINANNLEEYKIDQPFLIGIPIRNLIIAFKSLKKQDMLRMSINNDHRLTVTIITQEHRRQISNSFLVSDIQQLKIDAITGYEHWLCVNITEFVKLNKELSTFHNDTTLEIYHKERALRFISQSYDITEKIVALGQTNGAPPTYSQVFEDGFLKHFHKLNLVTQQIKFYFANNLPLHIRCNIGDIGELHYFVHPIGACP